MLVQKNNEELCMFIYLNLLLAISIASNAMELVTIEQQKTARDAADLAVLRSDYNALKKNLEKAFKIEVTRHGGIEFGQKIFTKKDVEYIANYFKNAEIKEKYYESDEFKNYQEQRKFAAICGTTFLGAALVKGFQLFTEKNFSGSILVGALSGGLIGYYLHRSIGSKHDSLKRMDAGFIKTACKIMQEQANVDLKKAKEEEKEILKNIVREELAAQSKKSASASTDIDKILADAASELG
jgi:hypothetical protein